MQPTTSNKPVMDVAAPRPAPASVAPPAQASGQLSVRPAPFAQPTSQSFQAPAATAPVHKSKQAQAAAAVQPHFPVALVTVTVFIMLVLSALAVTVYMTSQTA
jgi:hypothetical protein